MTTRKKRDRSRFIRGLLGYIFVFLLVAAVALGVFYSYLVAFESSRVSTCVQKYIDDCKDKQLTYQWGVVLGKLDTHTENSVESQRWAQEKLENAVTRELISGNSEEKVYGLYDENGICFEQITLRQTDKNRWGFAGWEVSKEQISIDAFTTSVSIIVPEDYYVCIGNSVLDDSYIVETGLPYDLLEPFENYLKPAPKKVRYQVGPLLAKEELTVYDDQGQFVPMEQQTEYHYLDNCNEEEKARLTEFASRYLSIYLPYAGDLNRSGMAYYWDLFQMIIHGGDLETRIQQAQAGFGYGNTMELSIVSTDFNCCSNLGNGHYLTDVSYRTRTVGLHGPVEEDNQMILLIREENKNLYAEAMYLS